MRYLNIASGLLVVCALAAPSYAGAEREGESPQAAHAFVQGFYDWYVQQSQRHKDMSSVELALKDKPGLFSDAILRGLHEDLEASAKSPDEVVGLDFDPFLNSQEVCAPYKVGKITKVKGGYRVEVSGSCPKDCDDSGQPDVIAEAKTLKGKWVFTDFIYPGNADLFTVLSALKDERQYK